MSNQKLINTWKKFFQEKSITESVITSYINYIKAITKKNVPIIFEFEHLCKLLGRSNEYLASVVNSPSNHYYTFKIPKRNGGTREITSPYPALLEIQYWILENILKTITISPYAHGFAYKKSIISNSKIHIGQKELLKIDLKDYFPSIKINRIITVFKKLGYPNEISFLLAAICSYEEHLPQGAPTSPYLSNIVSKKLDKRLIFFAKKFDLKYTRYADDLTFSGNQIPVKLIEYIDKIIVEEGFEVNKTKTRLYKNKSKRIVTGISVSGNEIKIPREYKRLLKTELHYIFKYGLKSHTSKKKIKKSNYLLSIYGKVNFWLSVEPENLYALESRRKLIEIYKTILNS